MSEPNSIEVLRDALMDHADDLRAYIMRALPVDSRSTLSVDDVLQEVWIAAFRRLDVAPLEREDLLRWLMLLARNKIYDGLRLQRAKARGGPNRTDTLIELHSFLDRNATPESEAAVSEAAEAVRAALAELPGDTAEVIRLRYFEGLSFSEIGRRIGKSTPAVHMLTHRGLKRLREMLASTLEDE